MDLVLYTDASVSGWLRPPRSVNIAILRSCPTSTHFSPFISAPMARRPLLLALLLAAVAVQLMCDDPRLPSP